MPIKTDNLKIIKSFFTIFHRLFNFNLAIHILQICIVDSSKTLQKQREAVYNHALSQIENYNFENFLGVRFSSRTPRRGKWLIMTGGTLLNYKIYCFLQPPQLIYWCIYILCTCNFRVVLFDILSRYSFHEAQNRGKYDKYETWAYSLKTLGENNAINIGKYCAKSARQISIQNASLHSSSYVRQETFSENWQTNCAQK